MQIDYIDLTKKAVNIIVGAGVAKIVAKTVRHHVAPENWIGNVSITAGTWVLSGIVRDASKDFTDAKIDQAVTWWNEKVVPAMKQNQE
jgi:hypothetical protein